MAIVREDPAPSVEGALIGTQPITSIFVQDKNESEPEDTQFAGEYGKEEVFFAVCGMKVKTDFSGLISDTGKSEKWNDGKGGYVVVQNAQTLKSVTYSHLSEVYVLPGDFVEKGEILGTAGSSGELLSGGGCEIGVASE